MKQIPSQLIRWPNPKARQSLAKRLNLPYSEEMQDWEWEVAQPERFQEFIVFLEREALTDDERFSLVEILVQCVEEILENTSNPNLERCKEWKAVVKAIELRPRLHASTLQYWSEGDFQVSEGMKIVLKQMWSELTQVD